MLKEIAERGSPARRDRALKTLLVSEQFRGQREALTGLPGLATRALVVGKQRHVYDAEYGSTLPGRLARAEGAPATGDPAADEAYDGSGVTYDLYRDVYERNSIDGGGMRLDSTVHYQQGYDNAFWDGQQMVYGDGDEDLPEAERLFNRFTIALDVIAHELTHGVTQYEAKLAYWDQSGALNESFSDVFGSLVRQRVLGQAADEADWIIGAGLFTPRVDGVGIRSMKAPGTAYDDPVLGRDPQPAHIRDYKQVDYDNGGVHINSGIPNHAFYVVARELGGNAWEQAGRIWYVALRDRLEARSDFAAAARITHALAGELYGAGSLEQQAVRAGWAEVGISVEGDDTGNGKSGCLTAPAAALATLLWPPGKVG
ncbi:MAG: peptidase M4 family protein [Chloroflexi bacterium HGW-Chloroflexi-1]|nr:MAG: peptidase M4 family protein [Chloroflexi bacterium HGW-Chloroflexi-1]